MLIHEINLKKGVTGWQLVIVVSIILGIIILMLTWVFMETVAELSYELFVKLSKEVKEKVCDALGIFGQTIGKLFGC